MWASKVLACKVGGVTAAFISLCLPVPASAGLTSTFQVEAKVVAGCEINNSTPTANQNFGGLGALDFGTHSALATGIVSTSLAQNTGFKLSCTPSVSLTMSVNNGLHAGVTRNLQEPGSDRMAYTLYREATYNQVLLPNQAFAISFSNPNTIILPIYGRLTLAGNHRSGTYSDTVVVTLAW